MLRMVVLMAPPVSGAARGVRAAAGEAQRTAGNLRFIRGKRGRRAPARGSVAGVERPLERGEGAGEEEAHRVGGLVGRRLRLQGAEPRGGHHHGLLDDLPAVDAGQGLAARLGLRVASVYQAKSRVNKMLEEALRGLLGREAISGEEGP